MSNIMEIPRESVMIIQDEYCCSSCWNHVVIRLDRSLDGDQVIVDCGTEDCTTPGLVSARYVEKRLDVALSEANEAKEVLKSVVSWLNTPKASTKNILSELGYE